VSQTLSCLEHPTWLLGVFLRRGQTKGLCTQDPKLTVRERTVTDNIIPLPYRLMCSRHKLRRRGLHQSRVCVKLLMRPSSPCPLEVVRPDLRVLHQRPPASLGCSGMRPYDFGTLLGKQRAISGRRQREGFGPLGPCFSNECVFPFSRVCFFSYDCEVLRRFRPGTPIGRAIAYPSEDKLASIQPRGNANSSHRETRVLLFRPGSAISFRVCLIQFGTRNATRYSPAECRAVRLQPCRRRGLLGRRFVRR